MISSLISYISENRKFVLFFTTLWFALGLLWSHIFLGPAHSLNHGIFIYLVVPVLVVLAELCLSSLVLRLGPVLAKRLYSWGLAHPYEVVLTFFLSWILFASALLTRIWTILLLAAIGIILSALLLGVLGWQRQNIQLSRPRISGGPAKVRYCAFCGDLLVFSRGHITGENVEFENYDGIATYRSYSCPEYPTGSFYVHQQEESS